MKTKKKEIEDYRSRRRGWRWPRTRQERRNPKCEHLAVEKSDDPCQA